MTKTKKSKGKGKVVVHVVAPRAPPRAPAALTLRLLGGAAADLLSMVLVRWSAARLQRFSALVLAVLARRDPLRAHETEELDALEMECSRDRAVLFTRFYADALRHAQEAPPPQLSARQQDERVDYYRALLRGCFLIALARDARVLRFTLAQHSLLPRLQLLCVPVSVAQARAFVVRVRELVDAFFGRQISLRLLAERAVQAWRDDFMLCRFEEERVHQQPQHYGEEEEEERKTYHELAVDKDGGEERVDVAVFGGAGIDSDEEVVDGAR